MNPEKGRDGPAGQMTPAPNKLDTAWKFLDEHRHLDLDVDFKALRRKTDWHIVPLMFCCYTMQFLDKVVLNVRPQLSTRHNTRSDTVQVRKCHGSLV